MLLLCCWLLEGILEWWRLEAIHFRERHSHHFGICIISLFTQFHPRVWKNVFSYLSCVPVACTCLWFSSLFNVPLNRECMHKVAGKVKAIVIFFELSLPLKVVKYWVIGVLVRFHILMHNTPPSFPNSLTYHSLFIMFIVILLIYAEYNVNHRKICSD